MRYVLATLLLLNLLAELLAAVTLLGGPGGVADAGSGNQWSMHYGFAVLAIAGLSFWGWRFRGERAALTVTLATLQTFHTAVFLSLLLAGDQPAGVAIHGVLMVLTLVVLLNRGKLLDS